MEKDSDLCYNYAHIRFLAMRILFMDMKAIEAKWQKKWEKEKLYAFNKKNIDKKFYCLEMFSYPSASKLHLGHWYNYCLTDRFA